jgi:hypothetical protein
MVTVIPWLFLALLLVVLALVSLRRRRPKPTQLTYRVLVELYAIRRRLDVSQFKLEARRDAAMLRRKLRDELDELDRRNRGRP